MDPLSAFSLTCNIIQVVDFGSKALAMCKEIYDRGTLSEYQDLEETTKHLIDLRRSLGLSGGGNTPSRLGSAQILPQQDDLLMKVAKQCSETAEQLVKRLQKFSVAGPRHKKRQAISKAFKAMWKGGDIQQLQRQLDAHQKALDTRILIGLRYVRRLDSNYLLLMILCRVTIPGLIANDLCLYIRRHRQDLTSLQQRQDFQAIDLKVQTLICNLAQGPKTFEVLRALIRYEHGKTQKLIKDEHVQTREHVTKSLQERDHVQEEKEFRTQFHRSLWFDELYSREESIRFAHPQTFRWILDKSAKNMGQWDNFVEWLELGQGTYWISGKPGSGKSTLMGFICQNHCTIESLRVWSTNKDILVLKFYFWSGGTSLQKSINGLLRSLLWQILQRVPNLGLGNGSSLTAEPIASWTERRLRTLFANIIPQVSETHRICIFLDGLDEFDGDQDELVSWIRETLRNPEIKTCLSSRLYRAFDQAFASSSKLRLQDLTRNDIRKFVVNKFQDKEVLRILPTAAEASDWLEWMKNNILDRAEGVFLWVDLAVKDQIRGLKNGDSLRQLEESLECLPDEIEDIYARMLSQIKKQYRKEASLFMQIALYGRDLSLLSHILAMQPDLDGMLSSPDGMLEHLLITSHHTVAKRLATSCAGLLEVNDEYARANHELHTRMDDDESCYSPKRDEPYPGSHLEESGSDFSGGEPQTNSIGEDADSADKHLYANSENEIFDAEEILAGPGGLDICLESQVAFVHRTAVDFMTDQKQGGAFLNVNTPINFDPKTFHVKNLLAQVKLLGVSQSREFKVDYAIDDIMSSISDIEFETGVAQTKLCSLTDDIMSRIDRDHTGHEDSHWSARWGPDELKQQKEDVISSISSKSSRSRFKGPVSSIDLQSEDNDDSSNVLRREPSYVSLAAWYGLYLYVREVLEGRRTPLEISSANWLLYVSVRSLDGGVFAEDDARRSVPALQLVNEMIRRGANPNCAISGVDTIWSFFMTIMHETSRFWFSILETTPIIHRLRFAYAQSTVAFCENGADLKKKCFPTFVFQSSKPVEDQNEVYYCIFDVDLSALAFAELYLNSQSEISRIRELCFSSGVSYYARCFRFRFKKVRGELLEEYDLSEADSDVVIEILRKRYSNPPRRDLMEDLCEEIDDKLLRKLLRLFATSERLIPRW